MNAKVTHCDDYCAKSYCFTNDEKSVIYASGCPDSIGKNCPNFQPSQLKKSSNDPDFVYSVEGNHIVTGCKSWICSVLSMDDYSKVCFFISLYNNLLCF